MIIAYFLIKNLTILRNQVKKMLGAETPSKNDYSTERCFLLIKSAEGPALTCLYNGIAVKFCQVINQIL